MSPCYSLELCIQMQVIQIMLLLHNYECRKVKKKEVYLYIDIHAT